MISRMATQKASATLKSLRDTIFTLDERAIHEGEAFHELSASVSDGRRAHSSSWPDDLQCPQADSMIAASVNEASRLISASDPLATRELRTPRKTQARPGSNDLLTSLSSFASLRSQIVRHAEDGIENITKVEASLPAQEELSFEAERLQETLADNGLREAAYEAAYREELLSLCRLLEEGSAFPITAPFSDSEPSEELDVRKELIRAWEHDQAAILVAREQILDQVCNIRTGSE